MRLRLVLVGVFGFCAPAAPALVSAATLNGQVTAGEGIEVPEPLSVAVDAWVCAPEGKTADPRLVLGAGRGLSNVVVTVNVADAPALEADGVHLIDQQGCVFEPHVSLVAPGQEVRVRNSDRVLHNFRTITQHNRSVNKAQIGGKEDTFVFATPEIVRAECDVHYWMSAIIVVAPHRFVAVTDDDGNFAIEDLPPGTLEIRLWHERLGERSTATEISEKTGRFEFSWPPADPEPASDPKQP